MSNRTEWLIVQAQIVLRNQVRVQYASDDIKEETRPGVKTHHFTFLLEVDKSTEEEYRRELVMLHIKNEFRFSPKLVDGGDDRFEVESLSFTKPNSVFRAVTQEN